MSEALGKRRSAYRRALQRVSRVYRSAALLFCNTLVLLVALNALLSVLFHVKDASFPETNRAASAYHARLKSVYPTLSLPEIRELMADTWGRRVTSEQQEADRGGRKRQRRPMCFRVAADPNLPL